MWFKIFSFSLLLASSSLLNGAQSSSAAGKPVQLSVRQQLDQYAAEKPNAQNLTEAHELLREKWGQVKTRENELYRKGSLIVVSAVRKAQIQKLKARLEQLQKEQSDAQARIQFLDSTLSQMQAERTLLIKNTVATNVENGLKLSSVQDQVEWLRKINAAQEERTKAHTDKVAALEALNRRQSELLAEQIKKASMLEEENARLKADAKKKK